MAGITLIVQPEMAYLRIKRVTIPVSDPPPWRLFAPCSIELEEGLKDDDVYGILRELLIDLPDREEQ